MTRCEPCSRAELAECLRDARARTLRLVDDLSDDAWLVPQREILNPILWEIGHVGWFQENWILRHLAGRDPLHSEGDELWNSSDVLHDSRWSLRLPDRPATLDYVAVVLEDVLERLEETELDPKELELHRLVLFHEDMHDEAFVMLRQELGYAAPEPGLAPAPSAPPAPCRGDVSFAGGTCRLGARPEGGAFAFDNELEAHMVELTPFALARSAVTQAEFRAFVEDGGYARDELWSAAGARWRSAAGARHPVHWRRTEDDGWERRHFERWLALEDDLPVHHVNAFEAEAFSSWAGRRLPTEAEWEHAAGESRHPWGDADAEPTHARLDLDACGCAPASAYAAGDTPRGCRQLLGNVWEWTASPFRPYPGFRAGDYADYSVPWFGTHRVLRGGSWATRARMLRGTWRNFYKPYRRDVLAGFRTAVDA